MYLLNSEGDILTATKSNLVEHTGNSMKINTVFKIHDKHKRCIATLTEKQIFEFTRGKITLTDSDGKEWNYSREPGTMKPNLRKLDEFIGVYTRGKTY